MLMPQTGSPQHTATGSGTRDTACSVDCTAPSSWRGLPGWESLRQGWLVRTAHRADDGTEQHEDRYFISNVPVGRLSPSQILGVVRGHWGSKTTATGRWTWCSAGRHADVYARQRPTLTLGVLRLLAYNLLQLARRKHLRPPSPSPAEAARSGPGARSCAPSSKR